MRERLLRDVRPAALVPDGSDVRRARVQINLHIPDYGRTIGPGQLVDLNEAVGERHLRDYVDEAWFEPAEASVEAPPAPAPAVPEERE